MIIKKKQPEFNPEFNPSSGKRVLNDIVPAPKKEITSQFFRESKPAIEPSKSKIVKEKKKRVKVWIIFICLILLFVLWGLLSIKMEIIVSTKTVSISINKTITLNSAQSADTLMFRSLALAYPQTGIFKASEVVVKNSKAQGTVTVFNKGKDAQVLIASTRLESPQGNIYKIPKTITVPGAVSENGKTLPGSIDVIVVADNPGADYNLGLADFTLPALKGSPKYSLVYARSKTEMKGGATGNQTVVGKNDHDKALANLIARGQSVAPDLISKKIPAEEFLLPSAVSYAILGENSEPAIGGTADNFNLKIDGEIRAATVNRSELEKILTKDSAEATSFGASNARISNLDKLDIKLMGYKYGATSFSMAVSGNAVLSTLLNKDTIKKVVIEQDLMDASSVLSSFPEISRAEVRFKPFWMKFFYSKPPQNPGRIDIILK